MNQSQMRTRGEGAQNPVKYCGRHMYMAPKMDAADFNPSKARPDFPLEAAMEYQILTRGISSKETMRRVVSELCKNAGSIVKSTLSSMESVNKLGGRVAIQLDFLTAQSWVTKPKVG